MLDIEIDAQDNASAKLLLASMYGIGAERHSSYTIWCPLIPDTLQLMPCHGIYASASRVAEAPCRCRVMVRIMYSLHCSALDFFYGVRACGG